MSGLYEQDSPKLPEHATERFAVDFEPVERTKGDRCVAGWAMALLIHIKAARRR